jgi:hypothetical protein
VLRVRFARVVADAADGSGPVARSERSRASRPAVRDELLRESPNRRVERLLRKVRPVLGHGVTTRRPSDAQRQAVRTLDRFLVARCAEATANVFEIGIG